MGDVHQASASIVASGPSYCAMSGFPRRSTHAHGACAMAGESSILQPFGGLLSNMVGVCAGRKHASFQSKLIIQVPMPHQQNDDTNAGERNANERDDAEMFDLAPVSLWL